MSPARLGVYGFLIIAALFFLFPLYVMVVTSLKTMPEIRLGHLFNLPHVWTFQAWVDAWLNACTGLACHGLNPGFLNSVKITVPSVIISIVIASINGYALSFWRYKFSNLFFLLLVFGAFVPYQVVIYPLIMALREIHLFATLPGDHHHPHHLRHADHDDPVPQLLRFGADRAVQGGARRRSRLLADLLPHHDPDVGADHRGGA